MVEMGSTTLALAQADVGFAIGTGTDVAIAASDITLINGSRRRVVTAIQISPATMRNVFQNLTGAFVYNVLELPVALGVLCPFFGVLLSPLLTALAMSFSSVTVISNASRLKRWRPATWDRAAVDVVGLGVIALIVWFFWLVKVKGVRAAVTNGGYQKQMVLVKGDCIPAVIVVQAGKPVRLNFVRQESTSSTEMVLLPAFAKSAQLPEGKTVPMEFIPRERGEFEFACQMGMIRGKLIVE